MDCGVDLAIARMQAQEELRASSIAATRIGPSGPVIAVTNAAAAGMIIPGESSDDTRLKVFDKQLADQLKAERGAALLTAIIGIVAGLALLCIAIGEFKHVGMEGIKTISFKSLRESDGFSPAFMAVLLLGNAIGALLCGVGQTRRFLAEVRAIAQVDRGEKPEVVVLSTWSQIGMLVLAVFCPLFGIVVGIMLKFSKDSDVKALGGQMLLFSLGVIALFIVNIIWGIAEAAMPKPAPAKA
jgi:hypothetical protein